MSSLRAGTIFGNTVRGLFTSILGNGANQLHWEVSLRPSDGLPLDNGFRGNETPSYYSPKGSSRVDFIIGDHRPMDQLGAGRPNGNLNFAVGDFKLSVKTVWDAFIGSGRNKFKNLKQWNAFTNYAKNYQYMKFVGFVTLMSGYKTQGEHDAKKHDILKKGLQQNVFVIVLSFLQGNIPGFYDNE